jgi:hypothetical protein
MPEHFRSPNRAESARARVAAQVPRPLRILRLESRAYRESVKVARDRAELRAF